MAVDYAALKAGGFMLQKQKDTFSLRLRVVGGNVTAEQLETIAEVAKKYGHGYAHLTSRQGVEIPFIQLSYFLRKFFSVGVPCGFRRNAPVFTPINGDPRREWYSSPSGHPRKSRRYCR